MWAHPQDFERNENIMYNHPIQIIIINCTDLYYFML